jgi:peptidylprolyl isomerase
MIRWRGYIDQAKRSGLRMSLAGLCAALILGAMMTSGEAGAASLEDTLLLELKDGPVVIEMRPDLAPGHVARIKELVRAEFYDGLLFHRVIDGFMAQTGDPGGDGTGGSGQKLDAEFSDEAHVRGTVSMARAQSPNSADSQFFIVFQDSAWLNGQYTVWGRVVQGMEHVDAIKRGEGQGGTVSDPDKIVRLRVAADVAE